MSSIPQPAVRRLTALALAALVAMPAAAQSSAQTDGRWQPWLGCWTPAGTLIRVVGKANNSMVCVVPSATASAVDVMTVSNGKIADSTHVDADGQPHALSKDGCAGWQSAKWSPSARRVYIKSEYNCKGSPTTHLSAVYAMAGSGEWIDVQGMRVDKNSGVHSVRYREADDDASVPAAIKDKLHQRTFARMTAMLAATEPLSLTDVEEASRELDPAVVSTWLIDADKVTIAKPAPLNAAQLEQLADNGVPPSVIDVMVGLSYPNVLAINSADARVVRQNSDTQASQYDYLGSLAADPIIGFDRFGFPIYASQSSLLMGCSPWIGGAYYGMYSAGYGCGYGYSGYLGYGYYPGYYPGYYGGFFGGGPIVVPRGSGATGGAPAHGRAVNGHGYSQGGSGTTGTAVPRSNSAGSTGASSPPPPPPRTAVPKKP